MIGLKKVLKSLYVYLAASMWIGSWGIFAVDQINISIDDFFIKREASASSVLLPGYVIHEKNGVKFMIKKETADKFGFVTLDMECDSVEFWGNIAFDVDLESLVFAIDFNNYDYQDYNIRDLYLTIEPKSRGGNWLISSKGYEYHNFSKIRIPSTEESIKINLPLFRAENFSNKKAYPLEVKLLAKSLNSSSSVTCKEEYVDTVPIEKFRDFENIQPVFSEGIFPVYDIANLKVQSSEEDIYIEKFIDYQILRKSGLNLPSNEAALALLQKDLEFSPDVNGDYKWTYDSLHSKKIRNRKTVIGLYGDVLKSDLEAIKNTLHVLHIVAPTLDISYSSETKNVTLPIHITNCKNNLGKHIGCGSGGFAGVYKWEDYIWVDASLRGEYRTHVLIHELGHALGLSHNLCWDSAMTYEFSSPQVPYFSHIDLMQLNILYHPDLVTKTTYNPTTRTIYRSQVIEILELSEERVSYYEDNIKEACYQKPGSYDYLIELQGKKK